MSELLRDPWSLTLLMMSLPQQAILVSLQPCSQACGGSSCSSACLPAKVEGSERGRSARRVISRLRFTLTLSHSRSPEASHLAHTPPTASRDSREGTACLASCCVCEFAGIAFLLCCCRKVSLPPLYVSLSSRAPGDCSGKTKHEGRRQRRFTSSCRSPGEGVQPTAALVAAAAATATSCRDRARGSAKCSLSLSAPLYLPSFPSLPPTLSLSLLPPSCAPFEKSKSGSS